MSNEDTTFTKKKPWPNAVRSLVLNALRYIRNDHRKDLKVTKVKYEIKKLRSDMGKAF